MAWPDLWAVEALIEHLILTNYQNTNLSESKVLKLSGHHGVVPLCLPVRSADIGDGQDLVVDRHDHYHEISYAPAADRPTLFPIALHGDLQDPDVGCMDRATSLRGAPGRSRRSRPVPPAQGRRGDAYARQRLSPYQSFHFDEIIP